jgi:hypothetical protein
LDAVVALACRAIFPHRPQRNRIRDLVVVGDSDFNHICAIDHAGQIRLDIVGAVISAIDRNIVRLHGVLAIDFVAHAFHCRLARAKAGGVERAKVNCSTDLRCYKL